MKIKSSRLQLKDCIEDSRFDEANTESSRSMTTLIFFLTFIFTVVNDSKLGQVRPSISKMNISFSFLF